MIHPSAIFRSDSQDRQFQAPKNAGYKRPLDCGISQLPCLSRLCYLEKYAKPSVFLFCVSLLGLLQGASFSYFRGTANLWMYHYNFSPTDVDWLLYFNDIFIGLFAFVVGYWGNKIHRSSWLGALAIYQAIACIILVIPETHRRKIVDSNYTELVLCQRNILDKKMLLEDEVNYISLVVFYLYQLFFSLTMVSFYTHGLTYIDDNVNKKNSAAYLCVILASLEIGKHLGMYSTWITFQYFRSHVFVTPVWLLIACLLFLIGVVIAMFPYSLPSVVMREMVQSIISLAQGAEEIEVKQDPEGFWISFLRLLKNKLLIANIYASVFMRAAIVNFGIVEANYYQSRFHVYVSKDKSGFQDPYLVQILTNLLKQPFIALSMIVTGLVVVKVRPKARKVAIFNLAAATIATSLFAMYGFLECGDKIESEFSDKLSMSVCNFQCQCSDDVIFSPVCVEDGQKTYFSPCHAGCAGLEEINNKKIFRNCSCGSSQHILVNTSATMGSCNAEECQFMWGLAQINGIVISGLIASIVVTNLIINLRCVQRADKAMCIAFEATLVRILPYVPLRFIYAAFEDYFCAFKNKDNSCKLHSIGLGNFVTATTVGLMVISIGLMGVVVYLAKNLNLYVEPKIVSNFSPLDSRREPVPTSDDDFEEQSSFSEFDTLKLNESTLPSSDEELYLDSRPPPRFKESQI